MLTLTCLYLLHRHCKNEILAMEYIIHNREMKAENNDYR